MNIQIIKQDQSTDNSLKNMIRLAYLGYFIWIVSTESWFYHAWWALKILPLLIVFPRIWRAELSALQWGLLLLHVYAVEVLVAIYSSPKPFNQLAWGSLFFILCIYGATVAFLRPFKKQHKMRKAMHKITQAGK